MKRLFIITVVLLNTLMSSGLYGQTTVGTNGQWQYERYSYVVNGREYCGYRPVFVQNAHAVAVQKVVAEAVPANVNHDNSVTYNYSITYGNQSQLPVNQGSTLYGYSYSSVADTYGNVDLAALYNMAIRLAGDQNAIADKANTNAMSLVAQAGRERARVAEILAKGQVIAQANASAAALASAASASNSASIEVKTNQQSGVAPVETVAPPAVTDGPQNVANGSVQQILNAKCVQCHKEGVEKGGLRLDDAAKLSPADVRKILNRVTTQDPVLRMPRVAGDKPGALSVEELAVLFKAAVN